MSVRDWDDGLASERTVLAWERTAFASVAVAALALREGIVDGTLGLAIPLTALLLLAAVFEWRFSVLLASEHDRPIERGAILHDRAIALLAAVTAIAGVAGAVLAIIG